VPMFFGKWRDTVMKQMTLYKYIPRENATDLVYAALQPSIRFARADCVDLPPCLYQERSVQLTTEQKRAYEDMRAKLRMEYAGGKVTAVNEAVKVQKLVQIACGVVYNSNAANVYLPCKPRIDIVTDIVRQAGTKTIVFVPFVGVLDFVAEEIGKSFTVRKISGQTPKNERDDIFADFQNATDPQVLVASPAAMSHGLTLTAANTIVWFAPINSNRIYEQANARVSRPGQKETQFIVMIEGTPVERQMYLRLKKKQTMQGLLLDAVRENDLVS
jgi:SNF2 family DNA or RNA helicase